MPPTTPSRQTSPPPVTEAEPRDHHRTAEHTLCFSPPPRFAPAPALFSPPPGPSQVRFGGRPGKIDHARPPRHGRRTLMNKSLLAVLNDAERLLVARTGRAELAALDEDAAIELEARIRRARNKYVGQYRRAASAAVAEHGGRGQARPENTRAAMKAEAFEEALSLVSRRVAALARQSAAELRAERLAATRAAKQGQAPGARTAAPTVARKGPAVTGEPVGD